MKPASESTLINNSATDLGAAGFGLMFYNARWYDPMTGRFAQADTIVPGGVQGLDRYAYVNNSPVNYVDTTGHFTEDAIKEYLLGYCHGYQACADKLLAQWKDDADWWNMLLDAVEGDVLYGTAGGGTFTATFTGEGNTSLTGINFSTTLTGVSSTNTTLFNIQAGSTVRVGARASRSNVNITWMGFFRPEENSVPTKWHIRPGYGDEPYKEETPGWARWVTDLLVGGTLGMPCVGTSVGFWACAALAGGITDLSIDGLDLEDGDYKFIVGPLYFNFNVAIGGGSTSYTLEHIYYEPGHCGVRSQCP
jgi:RHS repeat-associated protein